MIKFYRLLDQRLIFIIFLLLIASPLVWGTNTYTYCLIYSHYLSVYVNPIFLLFIYQYVYRLNQVHMPLTIRLSQEKYELHAYLSLLLLATTYCLLVYSSYYFFFPTLEKQWLGLTLIFMIVNFTIICLECTIIYLQLGRRKTFLYIALPIFINFLFHFLWLQYF